jgi:sec-independent protein translocase protein TatB
VVGPKELPVLLRTIGKYVAMIRRQANEFKAQFDEAMRETELDKLKKEVEAVGQSAEASIRDTERSINDEIAKTNAAIDDNIAKPLDDATKVELPDAAAAQISALEPLPAPAATSAAPAPAPEPVKVGA